jgi:GNAT superfamily N-acetyltransferase
MSGHLLSRLDLADMGAAARVMRISFDERLPHLAGLHTPDEDLAYFREQVFPRDEIWGARDEKVLIGVIAFRRDWIDQLYVLPDYQGRGAGSALLNVAKSRFRFLQLWTFKSNARARRFYERHGFAAVEETDGSRNEERAPDVRYVWRAAPS